MVAFSFRSSALLLPCLCTSLVVLPLLVDGVHASTSQQQKRLQAGTNRYLQMAAFTSDASSLVPSQSPRDTPSIGPSASSIAAPSKPPNIISSDVPSDVPSTSPSDLPSAVPSTIPSDIPSTVPSDIPSTVPSITLSSTPTSSGAPSRSSLPPDTLSMAPFYATKYSTETVLNFYVSADSIMDTATIAMFEKECLAFLPVYLPAVYQANYQFVECELLDQSLFDMPAGRRRLQEGEQAVRLLVVVVQVSARADLPDTLKFNDLVARVFGQFGSTLKQNLKSALPYFGATSTVPSSTPSYVPSNVPSQVPNAAPSGLPSDVPSQVPSVAPSGLPSDLPSDVPSQVPSQVPSVAPSVTFSALPSDVPSLVPNAVSSGSPSDIPSQVPSVVLSVTFSSAPSDLPSQVPSDIPSGVPSDIPSGSPSDAPSSALSLVPGAAPTLKESAYLSSSPSAKPSGTPTNAPTPHPSGAPSRSGMPSSTPSTAPSYATEYVAVDALNLLVSADSIMETATIAMFEEECAALLPAYLPAVYPSNFQFVECELLGQSLVDMPIGRRRLDKGEQQGGQDLRWLAVLVRVSARADLPSNISFNNLIGQVFLAFGSTLQLNLNSASPYFASTLASDAVSASTRGETGSNGNTEKFPIIPVAAAVVVGAVFAIGMAAFMLFVKRRRTDNTLPRHSTTDSFGSYVIDVDTDDDDNDDDDQKMGTQLSESTSGLFLPPTPIGVHSTDSQSFAESGDGLTPDSTSSASRVNKYQYPGSSPDSTSSASRDTNKYQYPGSYLRGLGLGRTGTNFDRSKSVRQGSARAMVTAAGVERQKTRNGGKSDMDDVMNSIRSSFASVSTDNDALDTVDDAKDQFVVTPSTQITFFGTSMGGDYARD
jgi:hypothetical protein